MGGPSKSNRKTEAPAPRGWWRHALLVAALWAATLLAYSNSFQAGLVFDSQRAILADSRLQAATPENLRLIWNEDYWAHTGSGGLYRPLVTLSYLFNYAILGNGQDPAGYHWVNFAIHAVNIALVYLLGLLIFGEAWPALAMAALWALHPVLTEAVTNVVGRADLLGAMGVLAGLLCYVRGRAAAGWHRIAWLAGVAAASAIAIFSKESGVVLLAAMVVYDVAFLPRMRWWMRAGGYLAMLLPVALYFEIRSRVLAQVSSLVIAFCDNPLLGAGFWTARVTSLKVLGKYLALMVWPARLSPDYSYNQVSLGGWTAVLPVVLWAAVAVAAVVSYRRAKPAFFFIAFFLATIAPVSNFFLLIGSIMAERFLYLPSIGLIGCLVWAWRRWAPKLPPAALAVVLVALGIRTYARNADWRDEASLWTSAVDAAPESYRTHQNMANILLQQARPDVPGAIRELEQAKTILNPLPDAENAPSVYATAGMCYRVQGDPQRALADLLRARRIDYQWNQAVARANQRDGKRISAVGTPSLYLDLGRVYLSLGQPDQAMEALRFGRAIDPEPAFFAELAQVYRAKGQTEQAAISLLEGLSVDASERNLVGQVVSLYRETAAQTCALSSTPQGDALNLECPLVRGQFCTAAHNVVEMYGQMRDPDAAAAVSQMALARLGCPPEQFR